ncbi:MAG: sensor histidine kinase [Chitinophagaceae bacterium]|nr:sensor histidine kinase [Chitinophagaceae bacterium]
MPILRKQLLRSFATVCVVGCWLVSAAQSAQLADTVQLLADIKTAQGLEATDLEGAKSIYRRVRQRSEQIGWRTGTFKYYANYTAVLMMQSRADSSLTLNLEALALARRSSRPEELMGVLTNLGRTYTALDAHEQAIDHLLEARQVATQYQLTQQSGILVDNLALAYGALRRFPEAIRYHHEAISYFGPQQDTVGIAYSYSNLGIAFLRSQQYDSASWYLQAAATLNQRLNDSYLRLTILLNEASVLLMKKEYAAMRPLCEQALALAQQLAQGERASSALFGLALADFFDRRFSSATTHARQGLQYAKEASSKSGMQKHLELLSELAIVANDLPLYDSLNRESNALSDSINNEVIQKSSLGLQIRYETSQQQLRIASLEKDQAVKRQWNWLLAFALAAAAIIGYLMYRMFKNRQQLARQHAALQQHRIEELEQAQQLLATQALLKGQEEERTRLARDLHDGLGSMLSGVKLSLGAVKGNMLLTDEYAQLFGRALDKLDESIAEMRRVAHSMMPEALLRLGLQQAIQDFCDGLKSISPMKISCQLYGDSKRLSAGAEIVIYRVVQELVNNVLKHAEATELLVQVVQSAEQISITVEDNGRGFDQRILPAGAGLQNVQSRVAYLNGQLEIKSLAGHGTFIHFDIPIETSA